MESTGGDGYSIGKALNDGLKRFLTRSTEKAIIAPLTNTETDTPLQDTKDKLAQNSPQDPNSAR